MSLEVRIIDHETHRKFVASAPALGLDVSFLQVPEWAGAKAEWGNLSIGWFDGAQLVGAGLVLSRKVPKSKLWLAYLPEGPVIDWASYSVVEITQPMLSLLKNQGAFMVKMGPTVPVRSWETPTLKNAIAQDSKRRAEINSEPTAAIETSAATSSITTAAAGSATDSSKSTTDSVASNPSSLRLRDVPADHSFETGQSVIKQLQAAGWTQQPDTGAGFGDVQPRYVFQVPLQDRSADDIFAGFNQLWRRNIRKSTKLGVEITSGTRADLAKFHPVYVETAQRDGFVPRGLEYFERMWDSLNKYDPNRMRVYLATHNGQVLAATTTVQVGTHSWYSYGASANAGREVKPSNAIQWQMITDALANGATTYDLRGISDTLDERDPLFGLIRFKLGTGGTAVEYVGEWDFALRPTVAKAFDIYLRRREIAGSFKSKLARTKSSGKTGKAA